MIVTPELNEFLDDLHRAYEGGAWHGPPLRSVLEGITAQTAMTRVSPEGHTICELVVHLAAWDHVVARRIAEGRAIELPEGGNFPPVVDESSTAWEKALSDLDLRHRELREIVSRLDATKLRETVAGQDYSIAFMLRGVAQHMAYHAGQIAILKKLADS